MSLLCPKLCASSIYDIHPAFLKKQGIKGVILDLDNTLVPWRDAKIPDELRRWVAAFKEQGIQLCLLTNNFGPRVEMFSRELAIPAVAPALKPRIGAYLRSLAAMDCEAHEGAVIGDQIFTDILGGNRAGLFTVLVPPLKPREFIWTRFVRVFERRVLRHFETHGMLKRM